MPCYPKAKADEAIAELKADYDEVRDRLQTANLIKDEQLAATRHNKYKRCLAMARWCDDAARLSTWDYDYHRCGWYNKWMQRWLKIAEKFKEAKDG